MKKLLLILVAIICFNCSSSDDDNDNPCNDLASNAEEIAITLINAALAYSTDNSNVNCVAYETAAEDYIEYAISILECLDENDREELEQEIEELEAEIATLNCT